MLVQAAPPLVRVVPVAVSFELGDAAVELAASSGLHLDDWEADVLRASLGQREDKKWAAFEVGVCVPRQNGKGSILEARELAGAFLFNREFEVPRSEPHQALQVHTAHEFPTSLEAFRRLEWLIGANDELSRQVRRVARSHGEEGIDLLSGERIRFRTRTGSGLRGFGGDDLYLDEAMILAESRFGTLLPVLSARPNPQVWYTGSAVDQTIHPDGVVFARVRARGWDGDDPRLVWVEYALRVDPPVEDRGVRDARPDDVPDELLLDPEAWAQANPAFGVRITQEYIESEHRALDARSFAVERLGVGDWPDIEDADHVIDMKVWAELFDTESRRAKGAVPCFAADVSEDRGWASIGVAGSRGDELVHVEVVKRDRGTGWVAPELARLHKKHGGTVRLDGTGPAASLLPELKRLKVQVEVADARELSSACGCFFDAVGQRTVRHLNTPELLAALKGAGQRPLTDAWAWSRKNSTVDISSLVAVTLAHWGIAGDVPRPKPFLLTTNQTGD